MRRAAIAEFGTLQGLRIEEVSRPSAGAGEILVRVEAAGVNPVDWKLIQGYLRGAVNIDLPYTPGVDLSGVVEEVGEGVTAFAPGDAVFGYPNLLRGGAYAEYAILLEDELAPAPRGLPLREAAGYPVAAITAYEGLFVHGSLTAGDRLLVIGGAGGVGSLAVQMGKIHGAEVWATTSAKNVDWLEGLGAKALDYAMPLAEQVKDVDFIFDCVGGQAGLDALETLKRGGRFVTPVYPLPDAALLAAREAKAATYGILPSRARLEAVRPWIEDGQMRMHIAGEFGLNEVVRALELSASGRTRGKLLVAMSA